MKVFFNLYLSKNHKLMIPNLVLFLFGYVDAKFLQMKSTVNHGTKTYFNPQLRRLENYYI